MKADVFPRRRLKYLASINEEVLPEDTDSDTEIQYIDIGNVDSNGKINMSTQYKFSEAPSRARRIVRNGDVIISTVRTYLQAIAYISSSLDNLIVSTGFAVVRPEGDIFDNKYCKYALRERGFLREVISRSTGVSYPAITSSEIGNISVCLPPLSTQRRIADFLDRETTQIDVLIEAKEQMLALLQEKRAAQIGHLVTKGLDANAEMKYSGLAWVKEVPKHWKIMQLKRLYASSDYGISVDIRGEGSVSVLRMSCIIDGRVNLNLSGAVEEVDPYLLVKKHDVLFNRTNSLDQVAKVGLVDEEPDKPTTFASYLVRIRFKDIVDLNYIVNLLNSNAFLSYSRSNAIPAVSQANLNPTRYGDTLIIVPPLKEQVAIAKEIAIQEKEYLYIKDELLTSISLLRERRSALITAAVTGQLPEVLG